MFYSEGGQRCKEAVGVCHMIHCIHQLGIGLSELVVEQTSCFGGHAVRQVVVEQYAAHMIGRSFVAKDISRACWLAFDACAIVVAGVTAGTEDANEASLMAACGTACAKHIGLDSDFFGVEGFAQQMFCTFVLGRVSAARTIEKD